VLLLVADWVHLDRFHIPTSMVFSMRAGWHLQQLRRTLQHLRLDFSTKIQHFFDQSAPTGCIVMDAKQFVM